ncbi:hypothetical protein [Rhodococcus sp. 3-2]|uniref:hypothetical protein n=1 Tax=Rhodococcus sp. 3-2 TaxID=2890836 RepID=UPI001D186723|nr:hypothetical protein [Rhodococcus sp. 3-2]MCC4300415.1 hypothetical protein [Rhodococcus sp. 3-2]MCC4300475.1 hypothetical protein [Rhodococcus sp. 3-2]
MSEHIDGFNKTVITQEGQRIRIDGFIDGKLAYSATHPGSELSVTESLVARPDLTIGTTTRFIVVGRHNAREFADVQPVGTRFRVKELAQTCAEELNTQVDRPPSWNDYTFEVQEIPA